LYAIAATPPISANTTSAASTPEPPPGGGQFNPPPRTSQSSTSTAPSTSASTTPSRDRPDGTGSLVLMRLDSGGEVMIAVLLGATAIAVIVFARLGGIRRRKPGRHQH
jgi:hypothetical protein